MSLADHMAVAVKSNINSVDVTYSAFSGSTPRTVRGAFVDPPVNVLEVQTHAPRFDVMLSDVPNPRQGDLYTIPVGGTRYRVKAPPRLNAVSGIAENDLELVV